VRTLLHRDTLLATIQYILQVIMHNIRVDDVRINTDHESCETKQKIFDPRLEGLLKGKIHSRGW